LGTQLHAVSGAFPLVILHLVFEEAQLDLDLAADE
jgi:hypothetical protein